ncbi:RHS repeat protein, partial [Oleiagrimonas citrea]
MIRVDQDIHPLGAHPFGENIGLYDGSLSFRQVDVSLSGTGPLLQLAREFHIRGRYGLNTSGQDGSFGDWDLSLPRLQTLSIKRGFANDSQGNVVTVRGWDVSTPNGSDFTKRCSHFNSPPIVVMQSGDPALMPWEPGSWWKGYHLIIPGHGSQDLLSNNGTYSSKTTYPVVTKDHWRFQCLSSVANPSTNPDTNGDGQVNTDDLPYPTGEGFLGIAPDGTKYWFNELVYKDADGMSRPLYSDPVVSADPEKRLWKRASKTLESILSLASGSSRAEATTTSDGIYRSEAVLLVTKIEDRFGNTLTYNYDSAGHLTDITASDGRKLTLQYDSSNPDRIVSVTAQPSSGSPRVWTYTYGTGLTRVTLPDGSHWQYDLSALDSAYMAKGDSSSCEALGYDSTQASSTGSITHPSGLTGTFTVKPMRHGQWNGAASCLDMQNGLSDTPGSHVTIPYGWYGFTITSRTVSGAGVPSATWHYTYQAANQTWSNHSCTGSCSPTTWTDVERPDGSTVRRTFDNSFASATESKLLRTDHYAGGVSGTPVRSEVSAYASPDTSPFPSSVGGVLQGDVNYDQITSYTPLQRRDIIQNGDTYTWTAEAYNAYAQVTKEKRSNSIAGQSSDERQTSYYNDTNLWVLGLPLQIDDLSTGETISRNVYDTSNDTLKSRYRFGQKVMDYTFNSAGQLASFTDGDGNTTSLSDYKRGIPQQIDYADGTTQSLSVDDFGQIGSITDQAGHTTSYAYDDVGRVTRIDYPSGGSVAWAPKTFTYSYITSAERGIGADHWRRTVQTGSAQQVTWFDAELRPVLSESYDSASSAPHTSSAIAYDWRGLKTFVSYPAAGSPSVSAFVSGTHNTYDALGRVTQVVQDAESTYGTLTSTTAYLSGARKQVTDPEGHVTTTSYQVFDQPTYDAVTKVQAPESITQTIARNLYGDPTEITQSGGGNSVSKYLYYDAYHRLCRTTEPESGSTVVDYDAAGNIAWSAAGQAITGTDCGRTQVAAGDKTVRSYDAMNRVLSIDYPAGTEDTVYTYDDLGNVHTAVSGIATWTYAYNNRNVLKSETLGVDGYSWPLSYSHDANGSLKRITYPDGKVLDYAPDALGRPSKAGAQATSVSYLPDGSVESFTLGNGAQYLAQKNGRHLLSNLTYAKSGGALVYSQDMAYDKNANLTATTDLVSGGTRTKSFGYDALNRLTSAEAGDASMWGIETYTYDALNNIRSMSNDRSGVTNTYHYDANNLLTDITTASGTLHSYAYDAQGNTTTRDGDTLVFDKANRLMQVVGKDTYAYDASGRRVKKTPDGGTATYYAYSSAGQLMWEYDQATQQNTDYVYLGKKMLAKVQRSPGDPLLNPPSISFDANPNDGNYTVNWTGETGVSYDLQEKVGSGSWSTVYSGSNQSKSFSGRTGGSYYYRARECGDECGDWSDPSLLGVSPQQPTVTVPGTLQSGAFTVSWSKPAGTSTFDVEEQINGGSWTRIVDHVDQTSISRPATANGSYVYRVEANSTYGTRGWKTSDTVTVLHPPSTAPTVTVPAISGTGDYTASWNSVSTADSYNLQQQVDGGSWSTVYSGSAMSTPLTGGVNRSTYGYRAQACNASGCGPWGSVSSVEVVYPPNAPPNVQVVVQGSSKITYEKAEWDAVNYADRYEVKID